MSSITIEPALWPTSALIDWWSLLHRVATRPDPARLAEAEHLLRARLSVGGTSLGFSTEESDHLFWLMSDPDVNAVRLVLALLEHGTWRDELPRLVTGALGRQRRGAWSTTVANAWGTLAVEKFAAAFEATPVAGATTATLANESRSADWTATPTGTLFALPWPAGGNGDLTLAHTGTGQPWATIETRAAVPLTAPLAAGYRITKTVRPVESRTPGTTSRDDVLRVRLEIDAERDMTWVVVNDPIPAGAAHIGTGLARDSALLTAGEDRDDGVSPVFVERAFDGFRAYYDVVPKGRFTFFSAVKTGTSKEMRDNWCLGFSARYTVGVWVGNASGTPMHDVSGITGAAPVWLEIMSFLHRTTPSAAPSAPAGLVAVSVDFPAALEPARREWFASGTEPGARTLAIGDPRIVAPVTGTIVALDPDIPADRQRVPLEVAGESPGLRWRLDDTDLGPARGLTLWEPEPGTHTVALVDEQRRERDVATFEVRGNRRAR